MAVWAMRIAQNPSNDNQYYVLWGDGHVTPGGSDPPPTLEHTLWRIDQEPTRGNVVQVAGATDPIFWSIQVTNWSTIGGYTMTHWGNVFEFGGATQPTSEPVDSVYPYDWMRDFSMDPAANGTGYMMDKYGALYPIGGLAPLTSGTFEEPTGIRLLMDWPSKRWVAMDEYGRRSAQNGAVQIIVDSPAGVRQPGEDLHVGPIQTALHVYDGLGTGCGHGWIIDHYGHEFWTNNADVFLSVPQHEGWQWYYMDFAILDDGTGANPVSLRVLNGFGETIVYNNGVPPAVDVTAPDDPTTLTTRPTVRWVYGSVTGLAQEEVTVRVFTSAQYGAGGFDPHDSTAAWETTVTGARAHTTRAVTPNVDLVNGTYRAYVFVTDTRGQTDESPTWDGITTAAMYQQWVQNVTLPAAPTLTVTPGGALDPTTIVATGTAYTSGLRINGTSPGRASTPDSVALSITADIDIKVKCALNSWTTGTILGKWTDSAQRSWLFEATTGPTLRLTWSTTGANSLVQAANANHAFTNGSTHWVRVTMDVVNSTNRLVKFYTSSDTTDSADSVSWTQLGTTITTAGNTSIFNSTAEVAIGAANDGTAYQATGDFFAAQIKNGYDGAGSTVASPVFRTAFPITDSQGNVWSLTSPAAVIDTGSFVIEYSDDGTTWRYVTDGYLAAMTGGTATVYDNETPYRTERQYRAKVLIADPYLAGTYSTTKYSTVVSDDWTLSQNGSGAVIAVREFDFDLKTVAKDFWPDGRRTAVTISAEIPVKGMSSTLKLRTLDIDHYDELLEMIRTGGVLLLRDPFGRASYLSVVDNVSISQLHAAPGDQDYPVRHAHEIDVPVVEVSRPLVGPAEGDLALTGED